MDYFELTENSIFRAKDRKKNTNLQKSSGTQPLHDSVGSQTTGCCCVAVASGDLGAWTLHKTETGVLRVSHFVFVCLCSLPPPPQKHSWARGVGSKKKRHHRHSEIKNFHVTQGAARHPSSTFDFFRHGWPLVTYTEMDVEKKILTGRLLRER